MLVAALALGACRARTPTYHRDVAPILAEHCAECHRQGGIAPVPPLDSYENARTYAQPIRYAVQTRRMPPFAADNTGLCGSWEGARWLTSDEISTLARWHEAGAPEGEPRELRARAPAAGRFRADAALETGEYRPGFGAGGNRCFVADPGLDRDRLLTAIRVLAHDPRGVAQITLFALDSEAAEAEARALDENEPGPGYGCFGTARVRSTRPIASWTWPAPVLRMPAGTGVRLHARRQIVVQIHYNVTHTGSVYKTPTRVELELDDGAREARVLPVAATGALAPGLKYVAVEGRRTVERRLRVVGVAPRMHIRGETMQLAVEHGAQSTCLASFDHWSFFNSQLFRAQTPIVVEANDRIRISCAYGTLGRTEPVGFGDGIDDEECVAWLFVTD